MEKNVSRKDSISSKEHGFARTQRMHTDLLVESVMPS